MSLRICLERCRCSFRFLALLLPPLIMAGCGSMSPNAGGDAAKPATTARSSSRLPALPPAGSGRGGYYMDDGPGDTPPEGLLDTPDAEPRIEPYSTRANRPYVVFGKSYTPITDEQPFKQRGVGSWYGRKFHGQKTSSGEIYDMYKMTAAHPTLPIPSYVRVTNLENGNQVIVRVNDRGPFHSGRVIDLSYTAALKLGYLGKGSGMLEVERLLPEEIMRLAAARNTQQVAASAPQDIRPVAAAQDTQPAQAVVVPAPVATSSSGYYLQLGAFSQAANAEAARSRFAQGAAGRVAPLEVVEYGLFYRVYAGPFATRDEAVAAAQQLREEMAHQPMIVQR